ncbi:MAG: hypothetical protein K5681_05970 [Treponema sp.]|nr:hypothetical protein [Treponema sp.]
MTILNWIFIGLLVVDIGLLVFSLIKKFELMEKICCALLPALVFIHPPFLLQNALPDSYHTIVFTIVALSIIAISFCIFVFSTNKNITSAAYLLFFIGLLTWCRLFQTIFYIYRLPQWAIILLVILYLLILLAAHIFSEKKSLAGYIYITLFMAVSELLNAFAFISMIYRHNAASILFFIGSFFTMLLLIFNFFDIKRLHLKHGMLIRAIALTASQLMIAVSCIIMFY